MSHGYRYHHCRTERLRVSPFSKEPDQGQNSPRSQISFPNTNLNPSCDLRYLPLHKINAASSHARFGHNGRDVSIGCIKSKLYSETLYKSRWMSVEWNYCRIVFVTRSLKGSFEVYATCSKAKKESRGYGARSRYNFHPKCRIFSYRAAPASGILDQCG
jgi:hypothetical protein